ncbi:glycosyltransferase family 2 protein [Streptomyces roseoverticillatus]|uniref:glycosyltransferase family 2 protein n=1 Tax=Streptomyces roseoverticillatus TaxID=66429 RepID=UPI001F284954|nr:glycosyltransferase family 2 protein [Streptomyces roseoverticillatus]MCF3101195.1 glycosyltransferase family 2 protein [Streptomyces roseoverticillatus]
MPASQTSPPSPTTHLISVVLPCYNEEAVLARTHDRIARALRPVEGVRYEVIYVDDGSADATWNLIRTFTRESPMVRAVRFSRNFGHQAACLGGLKEARGDAVVVIDADLQDPPEIIPEMVARWRQGWHVVSARRTARHGETAFKNLSAFAFYRLLGGISDHPVAFDTGDFRLLDREVVDLLTGLTDRELFLRGAVSWAGFPETTIEYQRDPRAAGESKYTLPKMVALSRSAFLTSGSVLPLRLPLWTGTASLAGALVMALSRRGRAKALPLALFGLESLAVGTVGEYLHAVLRQVQGRPAYVISERIRSTIPGAVLASVEEVA